MTKDVLSDARINMLKQQLRTWGVLDPEVLKLYSETPRDAFVPDQYKSLAYADLNIPLSQNQSMMTPKEEARILQALTVQKTDKVLVLGGDSGFFTTLLGKLAHEIYYVDKELKLFEQAKHRIAQCNIANVGFRVGDFAAGWQELKPFDVIVVMGSLPKLPQELKDALAIHGRLAVIIGNAPVMEVMLLKRAAEQVWQKCSLFETDRPRLLGVQETRPFDF